MIAASGALGVSTRYGLSRWLPHPAGAFPRSFATNVSGCLLIGVLMVLISDVWAAHRLLRPRLTAVYTGVFLTRRVTASRRSTDRRPR